MDKKKLTVEANLLDEAMDADTLEDKTEKEKLIIENVKSDLASEAVKISYKKLTAGHAIVRQKFSLIYIIVIGMLFFGGLTMIILYGFVYWGREGAAIGFIGVVPVIFSIVLSIIVYHKCYKLFDVYFCKFNGKRIIFYVNRKFSILYKNRKEYICVNNFTGQEIEYALDDFMNIKMGFNRFVGRMVAEKRKTGYLIKTKEFKYFTLSRFSGNSKLQLYNDLTPKKILIGDCYIYKFDKIDDNFAIESPEFEKLLNKFEAFL